MESKITIIGKTNNKLLGLSQITSVIHTYGTALHFIKEGYLFIMKKIILLFSFILLILVFPHESFAQETSNQHERVMIGIDPGTELTELKKYTEDIHHVFNQISVVSATIPAANKEIIQKLPHVKWIEDDPEIQTEAQQTNWGLPQVVPQQSKALGLTGKGVKIALIDTGVNEKHPDLNIAGGVSFVEYTKSYEDDNGHGTHVAGIIGALDNDIGTVGVAPDAELYAIKALDAAGNGRQADMIAGIEWAINHQVDIINISITSKEGSTALKQELEKAYSKGILIVAAAGNTLKPLPLGTDILYPARYPSVIGVGSIDQNGQHSSFSYTGDSLEVVAPGNKIYSTYYNPLTDTEDDYAYDTGTSMATPFVTGTLALYKQQFPTLQSSRIRSLLQTNAIDLGAPGKDPVYGYGLVQAPKSTKLPALTDLKADAWYTDEINYLVENKIIEGYPDGTFHPEELVTRAEAVTMIGKTLSYDGTQQRTVFSDVAPTFYASGYIAKANANGIITGYENNQFKPQDPIIRGDVALIFQRAYGYTNSQKAAFNDVKPTMYYYEAVNALKDAHISNGYENGTFLPNQPITRAEFAVFVARQLNDEFKLK